MKTTILQPTYLPWLGYFDMIAASEQYVVFDHVQFEAKSWQHRNRILGPNGPILLSIPVRSDGTQNVRICDKRVDNTQQWQRKHLKSIELAYRKSPHFELYFPQLSRILSEPRELLADLTLDIIRFLLSALGVAPRVVRSSTLVNYDEAVLDKTAKIVHLCQAAGATLLYDGAAAEAFIDKKQFQDANLELRFQHYVHPTYPQPQPTFVPYMSVLDLLFNVGPIALSVIRSGASR